MTEPTLPEPRLIPVVLERGRGAWAWLRAHPMVVLIVLVALVAFGVVRRCNRGSEAEARATAGEQRGAAAAAGVPAFQPTEDLRPALAAALERVKGLEAELARAKKAVPKAKPVAVIEASTGPIAAGGAPRPAVAPPAECLLSLGDLTEVKMGQVFLRTDEGAHLAVGTASFWRINPGPPTEVASGPFRAPLTLAIEKGPAAAPAPRWGLGPAVGVSTGGGLLYGASLVTPDAQLPLLDWRVSAAATAGIGPGGAAGFLSALVRP